MRLVCCSPASHGACLASRSRSCRNRQSRESLTQDSRSAVKARLTIRYADHSAAGIAPIAVLDVMAFGRPSRNSEVLDHAKRRRLHSAATVIRAYVTSSDDARERDRVRATVSRHVVWRARWLAAHERREGLRAARTAGRRRSRVDAVEGRRRLRCSAGTAAARAATLRAAGGAMVPVV